jgi:hypothetical protein
MMGSRMYFSRGSRMTSASEIELLALVEKMGPSDLNNAAAIFFKAWCDHRGASHDSAVEFFVSVINRQTGEVREKLEVLTTTLYQIR